MDRDVKDALSALPPDLHGPPEAGSQAALAELMRSLEHRAVPTGRLARGWILGALPARVAAGYFASWLRAGFAPADERLRLRNEAHLAASVRLLGGMTYLRGAVMKAGQALANWPHLAPAEYADTLAALHCEAPPMHFSLLRELVRAELGGDPQQLFAEFDTTAFAAASIGQVHRARLKTGELVAVKIQYPGIARTIRADLANLDALLLPMRLSSDWDSLRDQLRDVRETLALETDYREEARLTRLVREALADLPELVVPAVHERFSSERVLTTELLPGVHLPAFLAGNPSQAERDARGAQLMSAAFHLFYRHHVCYADPHPGNLLFMPDGRLGLIDFGCCRRFDAEDWGYVVAMERALVHGGEALEQGCAIATRQAPGATFSAEHRRLVSDFAEWLWEPLRQPGPFDFGSEAYFPRGMRLFHELLRKRVLRSLPVNTWLNRNFLGVRALAYRLGARIDMHAIHEREAAPLLAVLRAESPQAGAAGAPRTGAPHTGSPHTGSPRPAGAPDFDPPFPLPPGEGP